MLHTPHTLPSAHTNISEWSEVEERRREKKGGGGEKVEREENWGRREGREERREQREEKRGGKGGERREEEGEGRKSIGEGRKANRWCLSDALSNLNPNPSCYCSAWCDLMGHMVDVSLHQAMEKDATFREGLPLNILGLPGGAPVRSAAERGELLKHKFKSLTAELRRYTDIAKSLESFSRDFIASRLPPYPGGTGPQGRYILCL